MAGKQGNRAFEQGGALRKAIELEQVKGGLDEGIGVGFGHRVQRRQAGGKRFILSPGTPQLCGLAVPAFGLMDERLHRSQV